MRNPHYQLGDALLCVDGGKERAIAHLEKALSINPAHARTTERLAEIEVDQGSSVEL